MPAIQELVQIYALQQYDEELNEFSDSMDLSIFASLEPGLLILKRSERLVICPGVVKTIGIAPMVVILLHVQVLLADMKI